jgi:hypothetical protein
MTEMKKNLFDARRRQTENRRKEVHTTTEKHRIALHLTHTPKKTEREREATEHYTPFSASR